MRFLLFGLLAISGAAFAGPPVVGPVPDIATLRTASAAAVATANAALASVPPVCAVKPASDTYTGSIGVAAPCTPPADAARATQVQGVKVVTDTNGAFAGSWITPFAAEPTVVLAAVYGQSAPFLCGVITKSATGFTGKCYALATMTLPSTATALSNLVLSPFQNAAASLSVTVTGRQ